MRRTSLATLALLAVCLLSPRAAWAKYAPPPAPAAPGGHVVTTVGWLSNSDIKKIDEAAEIARSQTGFVIDVLLAASDEPIDEVSRETFQAWKPGDPVKDNGVLLVIQPNFPRGERKVHLQVGKGVEGKLTEAKAKELMATVIGPLINQSDEVRTAVAAGVMGIAEALGAKGGAASADAGAGADASVSGVSAAATASAAAPETRPGTADDDAGSLVLKGLGGLVAIVLAYVGFMWLRGARKSA
jgi:uncharacterized protein